MQKFGEIESVKAVSELFSPVSGAISEVNTTLADRPELVNDSPYGEGWMLRIRLSEISEIDQLLTAQEYDEFTAQEDS
jgi:glycine cleavage system H protein